MPAERRGLALGAWGGISGLAVAIGPLVGGAVVEGISWQWIFWLNVPIGLALIPLARAAPAREPRPERRARPARRRPRERRPVRDRLGPRARQRASAGAAPRSSSRSSLGTVVLALFVLWELRAPEPMLPLRFFRNRTFTAANVASLLMFFGMFGSIFLLAQFFQTVQGYSPLQAGLRILPWTAMPIFVAPIAGALSDRIGGRPLMATGLALQAVGLAWIACGLDADGRRTPSSSSPFVLSGDRDGALLRAGRERRARRRCGRRRRARPRAPTTRSASSAASSASRCSPRCSRTTAATRTGQTLRRRPDAGGLRRRRLSSPRAPWPRSGIARKRVPPSRRPGSRGSRRR